MAKKYFYIIVLLLSLFSLGAAAQETKGTGSAVPAKEASIEGLNIYPNPVSSDRITITTSKPSLSKEIEIYDVVGKKILQNTLNAGAKELNISNLTPGVYIIKIKEGDATATRKLIVK